MTKKKSTRDESANLDVSPDIKPVSSTETVSGVLEYIVDALAARRSERIDELDARLKLLEQKLSLKVDTLKGNEQLVDIASQAIALSIKTSSMEKIRALQNAVLNTAIGFTTDATTAQIFLHLIDTFTPLHIKILHFFQGPSSWFERNNNSLPTTMVGPLSSGLFLAFPELRENKDIVNLIWSDLGRAGLHNSSELGVMMSGNSLLAKRTTTLGDNFLDFIAENGKA